MAVSQKLVCVAVSPDPSTILSLPCCFLLPYLLPSLSLISLFLPFLLAFLFVLSIYHPLEFGFRISKCLNNCILIAAI